MEFLFSAIYSAIATLPFEWTGYAFMQRAFLATLLITPLLGLLSSMVVQSKMAFFSDSLGHGAFTGIAVGSLIGLFSPKISLVIFSIMFAFLIIYVKNKSKMETDTIIGAFSSAAVALGLALMSMKGGVQKFTNFLIGDLLAITNGEIFALAATLATALIIWAFVFNKLLLSTLNLQIARSRNVSTNFYEGVWAALLAVTVAVSIEWVGLLLINSLLILPAAAARNVTDNMRSYSLCSVLFAMTSGIFGLIAAYYLNAPAGATIVLFGAIVFFAALMFRKR